MNIMNPPETNDPLDTFLRGQNRDIDDDGFTARVVAALPRRRRRAWLRPALLLGAAGMGYVLAVLWLPWKTILDSANLLSFNSEAMLTLLLLVSITGSILWGVIAAIGWEE